MAASIGRVLLQRSVEYGVRLNKVKKDIYLTNRAKASEVLENLNLEVIPPEVKEEIRDMNSSCSDCGYVGKHCRCE